MFKTGTQVYLNNQKCTMHGLRGVITEIDISRPYPYHIRMDADEFEFWYPGHELSETPIKSHYAPKTRLPVESAHDFSHSGLGIGGLATHSEPPTVPTIKAIKWMERIEQQMTTCCRCGESDLIDGAMFTNGGGDVCDDCF